MNCKTCGKPIETGALRCRNCGMSVADMEQSSGVDLTKGNTQNTFAEKAAEFGGVVVKEKKAKQFSAIDPKLASLIIAFSMSVIFITIWQIYERKMTILKTSDFEISLPASMRGVDDKSFEYTESDICKSYANNTMEFTYIIYDPTEFFPDLELDPAYDDIDGMNRYFAAENSLINFDEEFVDKLDSNFEDKLKNYKCLENKKGLLRFTYSDGAMVDNYVEMRVKVVDKKIYQFSLLCSEEQKDKYDKKFDEIYSSLKMKNKN